jgi:hypothetical protein
MRTSETIHECIVIRVDFVRAGALREGRLARGEAQVIDLAEVRQRETRAALKALVGSTPQRPRGAPGTIGGPF